MSQLHNKKRSKNSLSDEWETPKELYHFIIHEVGFAPVLDVCATKENSKCLHHIWKELDGLNYEWTGDVWCNPPHSETSKWVEYANQQWRKNNINVVMLIPANTMSSIYFHKVVMLEKNSTKLVDFFPLLGRIRFLQNGKESEHKSRNSYIVVVFKKRI